MRPQMTKEMRVKYKFFNLRENTVNSKYDDSYRVQSVYPLRNHVNVRSFLTIMNAITVIESRAKLKKIQTTS